MGKMLFRLRLLMQNRYGADPLFYALIALYIILLLLRIAFIRITVVRRILVIVAWAVLIFAFYRVFSTNIEKRGRENMAFMRLIGRAKNANITNPLESLDADKKYITCPNCKATLRVPRQKGKHTVRCPRCDHRFQIKIYFGTKK